MKTIKLNQKEVDVVVSNLILELNFLFSDEIMGYVRSRVGDVMFKTWTAPVGVNQFKRGQLDGGIYYIQVEFDDGLIQNTQLDVKQIDDIVGAVSKSLWKGPTIKLNQEL